MAQSTLYPFFLDFWVNNPACTQARLDKAVAKEYITTEEEKTILASVRNTIAP